MKLIKSIDLGTSLIEHDGGKRQFMCHGVFGEDAARANEEDKKINLNKTGGCELIQFFDTLKEAIAYWRGIQDMDGWLAFSPTSFDRHLKSFPVSLQTV